MENEKFFESIKEALIFKTTNGDHVTLDEYLEKTTEKTSIVPLKKYGEAPLLMLVAIYMALLCLLLLLPFSKQIFDLMVGIS